MADRLWSRRQVLRSSAGGSLALATLGLTGCKAAAPLRLLSSRGDLPAAWIARLPRPWQSQLLEEPDQVRSALQTPGPRRPAANLRSFKQGEDLRPPSCPIIGDLRL
jgi:hypothetical protein